MRALSAKEIGYLEDHFIESVTENWRYFRFLPWTLLRSHSGQTQKSNATSGFRRLELRKSLEITCKTSVGNCYKNSTVRENYKLGGL